MNAPAPQLDTTWSPDSWQARTAVQQAKYPDQAALDAALRELAGMPPLVTSREVQLLKSQIADAQAGKMFVLQGGDCAESFADTTPDIITNRLKVLLQMSLVMVHGMKKRVVRVGRFAGQYAKPRSADLETKDGVTLPSYRGDIVNGPAFTAEARVPNPRLLIRAHARSAMTLNFVRGLIDGGFADLHHPEFWDLDWVAHSPHSGAYQQMVDAIGESIRFMETLADKTIGDFGRVDFFTSHEALHLHYEQAQTRTVPRQEGWYNLSTHLPWIGVRTAELDGAHVEYCRGINNPIGIKIGPSMDTDWVLGLLDALNPSDEPGRIVLIHRMGAGKIAEALPPIVEAVRDAGRKVLWMCDPMHGNTESTSTGVKTRRFDNIRAELDAAFDVHADCGTHLGGVHLELTGENVTECLGGARDLTETDLARAYKSQVDPRLNYEQALELAMLIVRKQSAA